MQTEYEQSLISSHIGASTLFGCPALCGGVADENCRSAIHPRPSRWPTRRGRGAQTERVRCRWRRSSPPCQSAACAFPTPSGSPILHSQPPTLDFHLATSIISHHHSDPLLAWVPTGFYQTLYTPCTVCTASTNSSLEDWRGVRVLGETLSSFGGLNFHCAGEAIYS